MSKRTVVVHSGSGQQNNSFGILPFGGMSACIVGDHIRVGSNVFLGADGIVVDDMDDDASLTATVVLPKGKNLTVEKGKVLMDGKEVPLSSIPIQRVNVTITGSVQGSVRNSTGSVSVGGNVGQNVQTTTGEIDVRGNVQGNINSTTGDINIQGDVYGDMGTRTGNISARNNTRTVGDNREYKKLKRGTK